MSARSFTPNWVETFHDLQSASTVEGLWGVLVAWHGIRGSSGWDEPYRLFMRFHRHDSTSAEVTAALLCTDYRWRTATRHLIDRLTASGVLDDERLDELADWFGGEACEISIETPDTQRPDRHATGRRPIWPPLRRWAARHQVERHPERWRDVIDASAALSSRDAVAIVAGVMDAADHVPADDRPALAQIGVRHGSGTVRVAALPILASTAGTQAAMSAAQRDPSTKVRAWTPRDSPSGSGPSGDDATASSVADPSGSAMGQASLFDV